MKFLNNVSTLHLTAAALIATWLLIIQGAFVRATGSGAGCGRHWPTCNGEVVPLTHTTESFIEFSHRLLSLVILILGAWLVWRAFSERRKNKGLWVSAVTSFVLLLNEAFLGALTVLWGLTGDNVSMARGLMVASHLINSLLLVGGLSLVYFFARNPNAKLRWRGQWGLLTVLVVGIVSVLLLMFSGGIASMGNTMFPSESLAQGIAQDFNSEAHLLIRLRVLHPVLGMTVGTYLLVLLGLTWWLKPDPEVKRVSRYLAGTYVAQLVVGLVNLLLLAPVFVQLLHLAIATAIFSLLTLLAITALTSPVTRSQPLPQMDRAMEQAT
jgi:heme A synthase